MKNNQPKDYSKIDETLERLKDYAKLKKELDAKNEYIKELETKLSLHSQIIPDDFNLDDVEFIIETQLKRLKEDSLIRKLTKEEIQILDLLIKNREIIQTRPIQNAKLLTLSSTGDADLLKLAQARTKNEPQE